MVYHYICCFKVKAGWVPRFDQSFGIYLSNSHLDGQWGVSLLTVLRRRISRCDCLEEEGLSLLFSSILKQLQYNISQRVGDTSSSAVFVLVVDEATAVRGISACW